MIKDFLIMVFMSLLALVLILLPYIVLIWVAALVVKYVWGG